MTDAVKKLTAYTIHPSEVRLFFYAYLIKSVFFGAGVIELSDSQCLELRWIYEGPVLQKMGLSEKFPRSLMYVDVRSMGLGFLTPTTIMHQLKLKLFVGYTRLRSDTYNLIAYLQETQHFYSRLTRAISSLP